MESGLLEEKFKSRIGSQSVAKQKVGKYLRQWWTLGTGVKRALGIFLLLGLGPLLERSSLWHVADHMKYVLSLLSF